MIEVVLRSDVGLNPVTKDRTHPVMKKRLWERSGLDRMLRRREFGHDLHVRPIMCASTREESCWVAIAIFKRL
jgi:hypothetical protein